MAAEKTTQAMTDEPSRSPLLLILALAACVGVVAFSFYLGLQKSAIQEEQKRLDGEILTLKNEIIALEEEKVEAAQLAQKWLEEVEKKEIRWSGVITRVNSLLPFDAVTKQYKVKFLSYSGAQGGKLTLNGQSRETVSDPYPDVAEVIEVFNDSSYFYNAYVPSVTRGENDQGLKLASFILSAYYREEVPEVKSPAVSAGESAAEEGSQETTERVPRQ
ncbi:MAG TPA: hypothetical protein VI588_04010 [Candidatus Gracilibacteria bacterium]|nr:hypothetical protein [Candidatus Gracilibacteria bacterium]